jgi:hypothetical protein
MMAVTFPDRLIHSKAISVFKEADKCSVYNYRPVSLYEVLTQRVPLKNNVSLEKFYPQNLLQIYR